MGFETLRELEGAFYRQNKVGYPSGVRSLTAMGGKKQPTGSKNYMADTGVGKQEAQRDPQIDSYVFNSNNANS